MEPFGFNPPQIKKQWQTESKPPPDKNIEKQAELNNTTLSCSIFPPAGVERDIC